MLKLLGSEKTVMEVSSSIWMNLTSVYIAALLISPGIFGTVGWYKVLLLNLPSAILSFAITVMIAERTKRL